MVSTRDSKRIFGPVFCTSQCRTAIALELHIRSGPSIEIVHVGCDGTLGITLLQQLRQTGDQPVVELFHLCPARTALSALIVQGPAAGVIEEKVLRRDKLQSANKLMFEKWNRVDLTQESVICKQSFRDVLAAKMNATNPSKMIKPYILGTHFVAASTQCGLNTVQYLTGRITYTDHSRSRMMSNSLRNQSSRIRKIDQPCLWT